MTTIRSKKKGKSFTQIPNSTLRDNQLSAKATGYLALLLSYPDDWNININALAECKTGGRESVASALKELEKAGYLYRKQYRREGMLQTEYTVFESKAARREWEKTHDLPDKQRKSPKRKSAVINPESAYLALAANITKEEMEQLKKMDYKQFLRSAYWSTIRSYLFHKRGRECFLCANTKSLHIHHDTYKHRGSEIHHLDDLVILCSKCHSRHHGKLG